MRLVGRWMTASKFMDAQKAFIGTSQQFVLVQIGDTRRRLIAYAEHAKKHERRGRTLSFKQAETELTNHAHLMKISGTPNASRLPG